MIRLNVFIQVSAENRAAVLESAKELVADVTHFIETVKKAQEKNM